MYYITNQNNQIIAIDPSLSALLEVKNIDELYRGVALGEVTFSSTEDGKMTIETGANTEMYDVEYHTLSSMLGDMTLVQIQVPSEESVSIDNDITALSLESQDEFSADEEESVEDLLNLNLDIDTEKEKEISTLDEINEDDLFSLDILKESEEESDEEDISLLLDDSTDDNALFDLLAPDSPEEPVSEIDDSQDPILIDVEKISQSIGISTEDYDLFLNEYIDTALSLEKDLQSTEEEKRSSAIGTLSHLSNVLHLPMIGDIITKIETTTADDQVKHIESFYATLARLTTSKIEITAQESLPTLEIGSDAELQTIDALDIDSLDIYEDEPTAVEKVELVMEEEPVEEVKVAEPSSKGFGTIDLSDVKAIHFDFQLEEAANELSLPVELIEEFVHDFVTQGHTETEKMIAAYERGDLKTIQEIGHLLKGTSSNLRINPLADTLYEIQFCEEPEKLEAMIKHYWGHFLSLETQININSN